MRDKLSGASLKGRVRAFRLPHDVIGGEYQVNFFSDARPHIVCRRSNGLGWLPQQVTDWQHNDVLYDWATIAGTLLTAGKTEYRISGMYLEYKNLGDPTDPVSPPSFDRSGGIGYYDGLAFSPDTDFLRVPLVAATLTPDNTDHFPGGNVMTFFAQSQGTVGATGKPFSAANNSKVYGGALVAIPVLADRTQDLVFSRFYLNPSQQQIKLTTSQIGLEWTVTLE